MHSCFGGSCQTAARPVDVCRQCDARGHSVPRQTLESLLIPEALQRVEAGTYFFDPSPDCDVVYFSNERESYFTKRDVRIRVGIKESEPPIPTCYCFGHTVESARAEIQATGQSTVAAEITKEIQVGHCACEVKNPSGRCCLSEVNQAVKKLFSRLILATLLIASLTWSAASAAGQQGVSIGNPAPDFKLRDLKGKEFESSQLKGSFVVLDLWATWCEPCVADIPMFNRLHEKFASRGVKIVGVAVESGWAKDIKPHVAKHSIKYTVLVGNDKIVEQYQMIGFPTTFLIGRDGKIVKKYIGTVPDTEAQKEADLNHEIEMLLDRGSLHDK